MDHTSVQINRKASEFVQSARESRTKAGKLLRDKIPRECHGDWAIASKDRDALAILQETNKGRVPALLPVRYGRMSQSPFAFLRGSAALMAFDLSRAPRTNVQVQACGDCHLMNFAGFATPERNFVFDINDFDETLRASWEWDIKRLAASILVAGRYRNFRESVCKHAVMAAVRTYREKLSIFAQFSPLEVWYSRIKAKKVADFGSRKDVRRLRVESSGRAYVHSGARALPKLLSTVNGELQIKDDPPLIYHVPDQPTSRARIREAIRRYRDSLPDERRPLFDRYRFIDAAMKVVGVGSVGTRCAIALFRDENSDNTPLFLQVKEARASVLERYERRSPYQNHAQRVVVGQRLMQSASDIFLGWSFTGKPAFDFYVRQARDVKIEINLELLQSAEFTDYAITCAWALARSHAKTGDAVKISSYLGKSDVFDRALAAFARRYADQTERDHESLVKAVRAGRIKARSV